MISGFLDIDTRIPQTNQEKLPNHVANNMFLNFKMLEIRNFDNVRKDGRRKNEDPSNSILRILVMRSISSKDHEMDIW